MKRADIIFAVSIVVLIAINEARHRGLVSRLPHGLAVAIYTYGPVSIPIAALIALAVWIGARYRPTP